MGISWAPGIATISHSAGSRTSMSRKSRSPDSRSSSMSASSVTEIVEPLTASEASSETAPQNAS